MLPPLSLYIHFPWCIKKCPYCDFNSHSLQTDLPETAYIEALVRDFRQGLPDLGQRPIQTIFLGGGTPSLFSPKGLQSLLTELAQWHPMATALEVTMEMNPGTFERHPLADYLQAGINRISVGVQSFQDDKLRRLGRIHQSHETQALLQQLRDLGVAFNLDLMYALPEQSLEDALYDLQMACHWQPQHLSWYQLTLEPNTVFYHHPPPLPNEGEMHAIEQAGLSTLQAAGYTAYEVSAFAREPRYRCRHNLNYWEFGDYLGIGAGAHSKITLPDGRIKRLIKHRHPKQFLNQDQSIAQSHWVSPSDLPFEFMLNAARLTAGFALSLFTAHTGLSPDLLQAPLARAHHLGLIECPDTHIRFTAQGRRFLNDFVSLFLPQTSDTGCTTPVT